MHDTLKNAIEAVISQATAGDFSVESCRGQSGGCINQASLVSGGGQEYFVKQNTADALPMFEAEAAALRELAQADAIRVPKALGSGVAAGCSFLVLEALPLGSPSGGGWEKMGRQLAQLHRATGRRYGWHRNNTIGSSPQENTAMEDWAGFFRERRLRPQFNLARRNGFRIDRDEALLESVEARMDGHQPAASLLHGDLWSGNAGFLTDGTPVLYDPATYYGDRETDLAFSEYFGGFPEAFYSAYRKAWPLDPGYRQRKGLYNLYHVLNHANLFGGSYAGQAQAMIRDLLD